MNYFIIQTLNFSHLFQRETKLQQLESIGWIKKIKANQSQPFEQILLEQFLVPRMEYVQPEQLQRLLTARMLIDLNDITDQLIEGKIIKMRQYKQFYEKYKTSNINMNLWFKWCILKNKQLKQSSIKKQLKFYEQIIQPLLQQFKNTLIRLKFLIFYTYQIYLSGEVQQSIHLLINLKHEFYQLYDLKGFISEMSLTKFDFPTTILQQKFIDLLKKCFTLPKEDFFQLLYLQIKLLYPISSKIAPQLSENIFNEISIMLLISQQYYKKSSNPQLFKKYDQIQEMLDKYYNKLGIKLFQKIIFKLDNKPHHKFTKSLISFLSTEDPLRVSHTFKKDKNYESITSLYNVEQLQQLQIDLTKPQNSSKTTYHSRQTSLSRQISQFQPESMLSKEMWLEVDNYQLKSFQKRRPIHSKPSVGKIYKNIITSVPVTKRQTPTQQSPIKEPTTVIPEIQFVRESTQKITKISDKQKTVIIAKSKISLMNLVVLFNLRYFHLDTPGGKKLPQLITRHFLDILTYVDNPPYITSLTIPSEKKIIAKPRRSKLIKINSFAVKPRLGLKSQFIHLKANFSDKVKTIIAKIKTLIKLGFFKRKLQQQRQSTIMGPVSSKPQAISNFLDRFKTTPDLALENMDDNQNQPQTQPTPRRLDTQQSDSLIVTRGKGFGFLKAIMIAKKLGVSNYNSDEVAYLQERYGTLQQAKEHLYYPTIRYLIVTNSIAEIWKIKYKDLTSDKRFLILYIVKDGDSQSCYRFDVPVISKGKEKKGITIWPTVAEALKELDAVKKFSSVFKFNLTNCIKTKHSFISGLTHKSREKITQEDIESCGYVQSFMCQFHQSQITRVKKQYGYSFEILPSISTRFLNKKVIKYINMLMINKILSSQYHIKRLEKIKIYQDLLGVINNDQQINELNEYLKDKGRIKNQILLFRFLCTSSKFFIDGTNDTNLLGTSIKLFSSAIRVTNEQYRGDFQKQYMRYALFTLEIKIERDLKFNLNELLFPVSNSKTGTSSQITQIYGEQINKSYFSLIISPTIFHKEKYNDQTNYQQIQIQPCIITIQLYHQLLDYLEIGQSKYQLMKFESLINIILYQLQYTQTQKEILEQLLQTFFELNTLQNAIILKNQNLVQAKKMSLKFMQKDDRKTQLYAISPIEQQFIKYTKIVSPKEQRYEQLFKINIITTMQQYDDIFYGKQTIEEPDFMANNQEVLQAINFIKQIPLYKLFPKGTKKYPANPLKLNYKIIQSLYPFQKAKIFIKQSPYVDCQMPSTSKLKTLILSKSKELVNYFNCNHYQFVINRQMQFIIHTSIYYTFNSQLDNFNWYKNGNERIYYFDGEMFFVNISLQILNSRTKSVKMIFSYQDLIDLFKISLNQYGLVYCFDDKFVQQITTKIINNTFTERKFIYEMPTFLHRHYLSAKSKQSFINYTRSISISSDSPKSPRGNIFQINNLNLLERHNNSQFVKLFYDSKEQSAKNYCETYLKESRVIGHYIKRFQIDIKNGQLISFKNGYQEYTIITLYSHLIIDVWIIQIYIPKTSRYLLGTINFLDLASMKNQEVFKILFEHTNLARKSIYLKQYTKNVFMLAREQTFVNLHKFFEFTREINNSLNRKLITQQIFQSSYTNDKFQKMKVEYDIWKNILQVLQLNIKPIFNIRLESEAQNRSYIEKSLIEQLEQDTNAMTSTFKQIGKNYLQKKKNESKENQELMSRLKSLSQKYQFLLRDKSVITLKSQFKPSSQICINLGFIGNLKEFIHKMQLKLDKVGLYTIQFFLDSQGDLMDNPFLAFESINYANSSLFNLSIRILGFQNDSPIFYAMRQINVREILNLFIADGYFKYQTNYMNAKLSLSDLKQICEYIGFKIKAQNFLGLANLQKYINNNPIFLEETNQEQQIVDGMTYTQYKNGKLIVLQLFQEHQKVHINYQTQGKNLSFTQIKVYFSQIEERCPYFEHFVNNGLQRQALQRFMNTL